MSDKSQFSQIEEEILKLWDKEKIFEKSLEQRQGKKGFSFYDGPPFANGLPHFGHSLVTSIKDAMLRYKTMRGYYAPRRNGWDCHGLPVEYAVEKDFGVSGKKQILELGLDKFNDACRQSIFKYKDEWERLLKRLGRWSDYDNYYATVDPNYTESVWWALSQVNDRGLLYRDYKSTPYCPRCETPLSNFEVNDGYKDNVPDPSLYVKFKLKSEKAFLLAWTTTPWSLPGNAAIAVNPNEEYVYVKHTTDDGQEEVLILAKKRLQVLDEQNYKVEREIKGSELENKAYQPLFKLDDVKDKDKLYKIHLASFVSVEDGSGILHVAPAFGEDDLELGQKYQLPVLSTIDASGKVTGGIGFDEIKGKFFKQADKYIIEHLTKKGYVFSAETTAHTYPFCWRCETPLLYFAINSWFIKVSEIREDLLKTAEEINWVPEHIKTGRFGKWLEGARDWAISRNRYWGAPLPIWVNSEDDNDYLVVESFYKLRELVGDPNLDLTDVHRPGIDAVVIKKDGKTYRRVEEVLDCWFESGCMSLGQLHYPFENKEQFNKTFPADFIIEGLDQTRLWFYVQHVVATIIFNQPAFKNVVVNGMIMAADGQKLSKRLNNYPPVEEVFDEEGADSLRLYLLSSTQATQTADYMRFNRDGMKDLNRNVLGTLANSYKFFETYASLDKFKPPKNLSSPDSTNILDRWIISRLNQTIEAATKQADNYHIAHTLEPIFTLLDDVSNWYVRRSRRRFWKSENDNDKKQAYSTLYFVLVRLSQLLAPWAPFISEKIYSDLTTGSDLPKSVHLTDWPQADKVDETIITDMAQAREHINQGLAQRAAAGVKVRQPLNKILVPKLPDEYQSIIADELNVKEINWGKVNSKVVLDTTLTDQLKTEGLMRELVRFIQNGRKNADLMVEDRIHLGLETDSQPLEKAINEYKTVILQETLAKSLNQKDKYDFSQEVNIEGLQATIRITKA